MLLTIAPTLRLCFLCGMDFSLVLPVSEMLPTAIIDLDALVWNYKFLCERAAPAEVGAVVKAGAYGLRMVPVSKALFKAGCRTFFTESLHLPEVLPNADVVVLNGVTEDDYDEAVARHITPVINHLGALETWRRHAVKNGQELSAFIHLDTGMNRLGLPFCEQQKLIENPELLHGIKVKAWMTHFVRSEEFNDPTTTEQRDRFIHVVRQLPSARLCLCNSSGIFWGKDYVGDLVRPGGALYGLNPTPEKPNPMRQVLQLLAPILQVRDVDTPMTVGYGAFHRVTRKGRVAILALGYADGYHRALCGKGHVIIGGFPAPVVGRVSMDLITVDVTDVPEAVAHVGAQATVIGPHRPVDAIAAEAGTIGYEILTSLGSRIVREYKGGDA